MATGCIFVIHPRHSLAIAAERIGAALAVPLEAEVTGRFEEFPAFLGATSELEVVLLGPPNPEYDIRDNPTQDYALEVVLLSQGQQNRYSEIHQKLLAGGVEVVDCELPSNEPQPAMTILTDAAGS